MKKIKIGVIGGRRGQSMMKYGREANNAELVAICDFRDDVLLRMKNACGEDGITYYKDYDAFLEHDMDAVILANYAHQHAPFAIKALKAGKHVYSEVLPVQTMKEAVELVEAVESSDKIYAYGENYCFMPGPAEMRRLYRAGKIGEFEYGEGEYFHNTTPITYRLTYGERDHWRNKCYATFYCTHSLGPMIHITGLRPVKVKGLESSMNARNLSVGRRYGQFGMEMVELENGGIIKSAHGGLYTDSIWYAAYGSRGSMETARECEKKVGYEWLHVSSDETEGAYDTRKNEFYAPTRDQDEMAKSYGHGNSDFYAMYNFIRKVQGYADADIIDVYEALDMSLPGMFAYRSVLNGGITMEIPNLRDKTVRDQYRNDTMCSDPEIAGDMLIPSYSKGDPDIPDAVYDRLKVQWEQTKAEWKAQEEKSAAEARNAKDAE